MFSDSRCSTAIRNFMQGTFGLKKESIALAVLILISTALVFTPFPIVQGEDGALGFNIIQVVEQGGYSSLQSGTVNQKITVYGVLYRTSGEYKVYFNDVLVDSNVASGFYVASNFTIPEMPTGNYNITLTDVYYSSNTTYAFSINTAYLVKPVIPALPMQLQQGDDVVLNVSITGGAPNTSYSANVTITPPAPLNSSYSQMVSLTSSSSGTANTQITYPSGSFAPSGSNTLYTGTYNAGFNATENLGSSTFTIGFIDKTQYHRQETIMINALGYQSGQTATVDIKNEANETLYSQAVSVTGQGVIHATWKVPSTAAVGTYTITITPQNTAKVIPDSQTFQVLGYPVTFYTKNLAGDPVNEILIEVRDHTTDKIYSGTSYYNGFITVNLEAGTYTVEAYWNQVKVSEFTISPTGNSTYDVVCKLTNLQVIVQDKNGIMIPYADLILNYQYINRTGGTQSGTVSGQTNLSGSYAFNSTLPEASYTISASKYGVVFNSDNNTIGNLIQQPITTAVIISPEKTLTLKTIDSNFGILANVKIDLYEQSSGIFYSGTSDSTGTLSIPITVGQYRVKVYTTDNTLLNETTIDVFNDYELQIVCGLYNLKVTVKVVDYFGNPISNVNVKISSSGMADRFAATQSDGTAIFDDSVGGNLIVTAYLSGNEDSYVAKNVQVNSPTTVQLAMANYVVVAGLLIGISLLATLVIIVIAIIVFVIFVIYRKKTLKK